MRRSFSAAPAHRPLLECGARSLCSILVRIKRKIPRFAVKSKNTRSRRQFPMNLRFSTGASAALQFAAPLFAQTAPYPAAAKAGETLFIQQCAFCHGRDTGGGESGPDLTRSPIVAGDNRGSQIGPIIRNGENAMPPFTVTGQD